MEQYVGKNVDFELKMDNLIKDDQEWLGDHLRMNADFTAFIIHHVWIFMI